MYYVSQRVVESNETAKTLNGLEDISNSKSILNDSETKCDDSNEAKEKSDLNRALCIPLFLVTLAIVGIPNPRTIIWFIISFWSACSQFADETWEKFLSITGDDHFTIWIIISNCVTMGTYWIYGGLYTLMDLTNKPAFLRKYKVQPGTNEPLEMKKFKAGLKQVLFNQFVIEIPFSIIVYPILAPLLRGPVRPLPHLHTMIIHYLVCVLCQEITFYYSHRLLHSKYVFKYIHKKHHEWTSPIAIMAAYCHPLEHVISNMLPVASGVLVTGCHPLTAWMWASIFIMMTENFHSGYHIPFFTNPEFHDFHHSAFINCFGTYGLCDWLHGTDTLFKQSKSNLRNRVLFGFQSARELYPDDKKDLNSID